MAASMTLRRRFSRAIVIGMVVLAGGVALAASLEAQTARGPFARIAIMRALDGRAFEWEAGYIRHLEWHRVVKDPFAWYSYTVWASSERQRWIVYATFGHSPTSLSNPIAPADDERDNVVNVLPHAQFAGNWVYEYLPLMSRGNEHGVPTAADRVEFVTVDLNPGASAQFEAMIAEERSRLRGETLWYRLSLGGAPARYIRLRPRGSLAALLEERADLPATVTAMVRAVNVESLNLRRDMLVNVAP
jgi:hypothetical protein